MNEIMKELENGQAFVIGEYRGGKLDRVQYKDKKTGVDAVFTKITHRVEIGENAVEVVESTKGRKDSELLDWKPTIAKGTRVAVKIEPNFQFGTLTFNGLPVPVKS